MIRSMTAFARNQVAESYGTLIWELRSVNHRYLDIHMRLPDDLRAMEGRYRELISARLQRGKIECCLRFKPEVAGASGLEINKDFTKGLIHACEQINLMMHQSSDINVVDLLNWPGVVKESEFDMTPVMAASEALLTQALQELVDNREREGGRLKDLIAQRLDTIEKIVEQVREQMPEIQENQRQKILSKFEEFIDDWILLS